MSASPSRPLLSEAPKFLADGAIQLHASTIAHNDRAVAITGPSGSGKSALALALMARGASLIADDITWLRRTGDHLWAECPPALSGRIEARGVGLLRAEPAPPAPLTLIIDLGQVETDRFPPRRQVTLAGLTLALLHKVDSGHFPDTILQYLKCGPAPEHET